jgi:hypothetical protein
MKRSTIILLGTAVVLACILLLVLQRPGETSSTTDIHGTFCPVDSSAIDRITVAASGTIIELERRDGEWHLLRPAAGRANEGVVRGFLHDVKQMKIKQTVSNRTEKHAIFHVDSTGTTIHLYAGKVESAGFVCGKEGSSYTDRYARMVSSREVVLVEGMGPGLVNKPLKEWRDRTLLHLPREQITEVQYRYGDTTVVLAFRDSAWTVNGRRANTEVVNGVLNALSAFEADDLIDGAIVPEPRLTAQVRVGGVEIGFAWQKELGAYAARISGSPEWFRIEPWNASRILLRAKNLTQAGH